VRQRHRHEEGSHRRGGAQQPQALGADPEDILREDREDRHGPAEEHREEVQADGPEQQFLGRDEAEAFHQALQQRPRARRDRRRDMADG
jgi:hypothetical protein